MSSEKECLMVYKMHSAACHITCIVFMLLLAILTVTSEWFDSNVMDKFYNSSSYLIVAVVVKQGRPNSNFKCFSVKSHWHKYINILYHTLSCQLSRRKISLPASLHYHIKQFTTHHLGIQF